MLTVSLGFNDRIYLKYETMLDRAVLPPTHFPHRLFVNVQFALVALQSIMYVLVPRLQAQGFVAD
jgi:hypothetical protein